MKNALVGITIGVFIAGIGIGYGLTPQTPKQDATVEANLARFDELDFEAFSKQNWELFNQIHDPNVLVVFPDGERLEA